MGSVQDRLQYLTLITICISLTSLPARESSVKYRATLGVVFCWEYLELHTYKPFLRFIPVLIHIYSVIPLSHYLE